MKTIKVSETTRLQLDWLASKCVGDFALYHDIEDGQRFLNLWTDSAFLHYSSNWANGGPIIEREKIGLVRCGGPQSNGMKPPNEWRAMIDIEIGTISKHGPTPLIAAMRAFVSSKLGDVVEVPDELVQ